MFQKILLPTDGSRYSGEAARIAAEIAVRHQGTVHPLVAVEYQYVCDDDLPEEVSHAIRKRIESRAQRALDEANAAIRAAGGTTDGGQIVEGVPVDAIVSAAEDGEYGLIVMGSRGVSLDHGHERMVGSTTERVLHRAPCPVLVVRAPEQG
jgi:nucleotide-binding universal stress UspA family protein